MLPAKPNKTVTEMSIIIENTNLVKVNQLVPAFFRGGGDNPAIAIINQRLEHIIDRSLLDEASLNS